MAEMDGFSCLILQLDKSFLVRKSLLGGIMVNETNNRFLGLLIQNLKFFKVLGKGTADGQGKKKHCQQNGFLEW
jgi:hypothetical protein